MSLRLAQSSADTTALAVSAGSSAVPVQPPPRGVRWIRWDEAARRAGWSDGYVRRRCGEVWGPAGLARTERREGDSKPTWYIREDAAPEIARVKSPEHLGTDLSHLTDAQRQLIRQRLQILQDWDAALSARLQLGLSEEKMTAQFRLTLEARTGRAPSRSQLYEWRKAYKSGGMAALVDGRTRPPSTGGGEGGGGDGRAGQYSTYFARLEHWYLDQRKRSVRLCHDLAEAECNQMVPPAAVPSYRTGHRHLKALPPQTVVLRREGTKAFTDACEPYIVRDYSALPSNGGWNADHHRFDVLVRLADGPDGKPRHARPWLTAWQDLRSRKIVGWHIGFEDPNSDSILQAFEIAAAEHGLPGYAMMDNGRDFDSQAIQGVTKSARRAATRSSTRSSRTLVEGEDGVLRVDSRLVRRPSQDIDLDRFRGVFQILRVDARHVQPYHGQSKPIERFFRTVCDRFSRLCDTYCGSSPEQRPEDLYGAPGVAGRIERGMAMTLPEFTRAFSLWLAADYHHRPHSGDGVDGLTPEQAWLDHLPPGGAVKPTPEQLAFACMPRVGPVTVGQHGVRWQGLTYGSYQAEVSRWFGKRVLLAVPRHTSSWVLLVDESGALIGRADLNVSLPIDATAADRRAALAAKRSATRALKHQHRQAAIAVADPVTLLAQSRAKRLADASPPPSSPSSPSPSKSLETPFDGQLRGLRLGFDAAGRDRPVLPDANPLRIGPAPSLPSSRAPSASDEEGGDRGDGGDDYRLSSDDLARMAGHAHDDDSNEEGSSW